MLSLSARDEQAQHHPPAGMHSPRGQLQVHAEGALYLQLARLARYIELGKVLLLNSQQGASILRLLDLPRFCS